MNFDFNYVTDSHGNLKDVVIPVQQWKKFQSDYEKMKKKVEILLGIKDAMNEVRLIQSGKKKGKSLRKFLDGL
ncbi:MAG: hypothetical protein ABIT08_07225 [Bacteroidia bacterium]